MTVHLTPQQKKALSFLQKEAKKGKATSAKALAEHLFDDTSTVRVKNAYNLIYKLRKFDLIPNPNIKPAPAEPNPGPLTKEAGDTLLSDITLIDTYLATASKSERTAFIGLLEYLVYKYRSDT